MFQVLRNVMNAGTKTGSRFLGLFIVILSGFVFALIFYLKPFFASDITLAWDPSTETNLTGYKFYYGTALGGPYNGSFSNHGVSPILFSRCSLVNSTEVECGAKDIPIYFRVADSAPSEYMGPLAHSESTKKEFISKGPDWIPEKSETIYLKRHGQSSKALSRTMVKRNIRKKLQKVASELGLDPRLAVALAEVESNCNPEAVSPRGAVGVLQLMPRSFCRGPDICKKMLYDPDQNIRMGLAYLKSLLERFENDIELSLAAYNSGPRRVVEAGYAIPPIVETRSYVKRVREAMQKVPLASPDGFYAVSWGYSRPQQTKLEGNAFYLD